MQPSLQNQEPPPKVKNILIRHGCLKNIRFNTNYQHPERSYIFKYSPKYYKGLTLEVNLEHALLSKVKKIKKLREFTILVKDSLRGGLWFTLLANYRKEIEQIPEVIHNHYQRHSKSSSLGKLSLQKVKFLPNLTIFRMLKTHQTVALTDFLSDKLSCFKGLKTMRKLKLIEIYLHFWKDEWLFRRLNKMSKLLDRLDAFSINLQTGDQNIQELFDNKNVLSHLTGIVIRGMYDPVFETIPQECKKLRLLSFNFHSYFGAEPELKNFLTSIRQLPKLKSLDYICHGRKTQSYWQLLKPPSSLKHLKLYLHVDDWTGEDLFWEYPPRLDYFTFVQHWEEIKYLDVLDFEIDCYKPENMIFVRSMVTMILKKIRKLRSVKFLIFGPVSSHPAATYEPFLVQEVSHLYESLEKFEYIFANEQNEDYFKFDLRIMKPFSNLKALKLQGDRIVPEGVEEIIDLLQANQKEEEYPILALKIKGIDSSDWLKDTVEKIAKRKRADRNLKVIIDLNFAVKNLVEKLEEFCCALQTINGLVVCLTLWDEEKSLHLPEEEMKKILLGRYPDIKNLTVNIEGESQSFEYIQVDGEKQQIFID